MRRRRPAAAGLVLALALTGCSEQLNDRRGGAGAEPDKISDVDYVEVYRNADNFPNVAWVCVEGLAFATTASREGMSAPSLIRMSEWDATCPPGDAAAPAPPGTAPTPGTSVPTPAASTPAPAASTPTGSPATPG